MKLAKIPAVFLHIPKCGGMSVREVIASYEKIYLFNWMRPNYYKKAFKFTFIRNPWDRTISCWMMFNTKPVRRREDGRNWTLDEIINIAADPNIKLILPPTNPEELEVFLRSEVEIKSHLRPLTECNLYHDLDFIGRFENIDSDWKIIQDRLGIKEPLPHINATNHLHYSYYYNSTQVYKVWEIFREDIDTFKYDFEESPCVRK